MFTGDRHEERRGPREHKEGVGLEITSSPTDVCIACHQPLPARDLTCPACGAINSWRIRHSPTKRFLWRTVTVRSGDVEIQGHYLSAGVTTIVSRARWIATNVLMTLVMGFLLAFIVYAATATGNESYWFFAFLAFVGLASSLYLFVWTLMPAREPAHGPA